MSERILHFPGIEKTCVGPRHQKKNRRYRCCGKRQRRADQASHDCRHLVWSGFMRISGLLVLGPKFAKLQEVLERTKIFWRSNFDSSTNIIYTTLTNHSG